MGHEAVAFATFTIDAVPGYLLFFSFTAAPFF